MLPLFREYRRRFTVLVMMAYILLICLCTIYIVRWQPRMEASLLVHQQLQEQGQERWFVSLIQEAECFPIRGPLFQYGGGVRKLPWAFENGYGEGRSYGGARKHEGIDIMSVSGKCGELKVQSVSDGVVEQLGWLELGGYRVGIRSDSGLYFYYAHLDAYAAGLQKGDRVQAGTLLGYMGDTGYGSEGTRGKFPVHLHFGIYYNEGDVEKSLNPYSLLLLLGNF